jgi:hypothetical protein
MKRRHLVGCIALAILIFVAIFLTHKPAPEPKVEGAQEIVQESKTSAAESPVVEKRQQVQAKNAYSRNGPLAGAYEMAVFIDQIRDSVPHDQTAARNHLKGLQAVFFISDYVMAAKTNSSLAMTTSAITDAFTNISSDASNITNRLEFWADFPGTLSDHYLSIQKITTEKENIAAIEAAMIENGVRIDTESDLLMDCIRYVVQITDIQEAYGPNPQLTQPTPFPAAMNALNSSSDTVFLHRFETKFGLKPELTMNLMDRLKQMRLYDLSPADVEIPAHIRKGN